MERAPVTADDLRSAVRLAVDTLRRAVDADWTVRPPDLGWDCWEIVEHLADDYFAYAAQLGPADPPRETHVPFFWQRHREGGPANSVFADRGAGAPGLLQVLDASGALLVAMVRTTPAHVRAHHVFGLADAEGFAAMGVVETLVHVHDVALALGLPWDPPAHLVTHTLHRLFPDAPTDAEPWPAMLWCTGRTEFPGRQRLESWRWDGRPPAER